MEAINVIKFVDVFGHIPKDGMLLDIMNTYDPFSVIYKATNILKNIEELDTTTSKESHHWIDNMNSFCSNVFDTNIFLQKNHSIIERQTMYLLIKNVFAFGEFSKEIKNQQIEWKDFFLLCLLVNQQFQEDSKIINKYPDEIFYSMVQFAHARNPINILLHTQYIFNDGLKLNKKTQEIEQLHNEKYVKYSTASSILFASIAINSVKGKFFGERVYNIIQQNYFNNHYDCDLKKIIDRYVVDIEEAKKWALETIGEEYNFSYIQSHPFIYLSNGYLTVDMKTVFNTMYFGLYEESCLSFSKERQENFHKKMGKVFESYCTLKLVESLNASNYKHFLNEFRIPGVNTDSSDFYIKYQDNLLIVEYKNYRLFPEIENDYKHQKLKDWINKSLVDPYQQVTQRTLEILSNYKILSSTQKDFFSNINKYTVLIISLDVVQPISGLYKQANEMISQIQNENIPWTFEGCIALNLDSFDNLCHQIELNTEDIYHVIKNYMKKVCDYSHDRNFCSWDNFIAEQNLPIGLSSKNCDKVIELMKSNCSNLENGIDI